MSPQGSLSPCKKNFVDGNKKSVATRDKISTFLIKYVVCKMIKQLNSEEKKMKKEHNLLD